MNFSLFHSTPNWVRGSILLTTITLAACALPRPTNVPVVYDFGPGAIQDSAVPPDIKPTPLEFSTAHANPALNSTAVLYRLTYADAQQLKPYALARWSMPPAQLIAQRLREHLGQRRAIVSRGDITPAPAPRRGASATVTTHAPARQEPLHHLQVELEEFSQLFESQQSSSGVLRLRATLTQRGATAEGLLAQRSFVARVSAPTPDANGGVRALTAATDQVVKDIEAWLAQVE